jgi:hypothetical protein
MAAHSDLDAMQQAKIAMNLTVLKRKDAYIENIVDTASFAVIYVFNKNTSSWVPMTFYCHVLLS